MKTKARVLTVLFAAVIAVCCDAAEDVNVSFNVEWKHLSSAKGDIETPNKGWTRREIKNFGEKKHHDQLFGDLDGDGDLDILGKPYVGVTTS